jgi:Skp family chaperone for outer membrane proteins
MAEITNELIYELMKRMHADIADVKLGQRELKAEMNAMRGTMISMQQDIHNIYTTLSRHETRLDRIENRLELRELAEAQARFEPHP